jgi:hypothetical protein
VNRTQLTHATTTRPRIPSLERTVSGGMIFLPFYDPTGDRYGIPTYPYRWAPAGLLTIRQLRARGLRPGGQPVLAQILWRRGKRVAYLYREDLAKPKRTATPVQLRAIAKALRARRTCTTCGTEKSYYIPRSLGECLDCADHTGGAS